jgi:hypothetical protein
VVTAATCPPSCAIENTGRQKVVVNHLLYQGIGSMHVEKGTWYQPGRRYPERIFAPSHRKFRSVERGRCTCLAERLPSKTTMLDGGTLREVQVYREFNSRQLKASNIQRRNHSPCNEYGATDGHPNFEVLSVHEEAESKT